MADGHVSNKTVVALVFVAMLISIVGTYMVSSEMDTATAPGASMSPAQGNSGTLSMEVKGTGAVVSLEVEANEEAGTLE